MKPHFLALLLLAPAGAIAADSPRALFRDGMAAYKKGNFEQSLPPFEQAAAGAATNRLDPAVALYNAANALMELGRHEEASARYQEALRSPDLALQGRAYYNRGNALYRMTEAPPSPGSPPAPAAIAPAAIEEALRMYERALFLDPGDEDAKVNYELALRLKEQIQKQQQEQQPQNQQQQEKKDDQSQENKKRDQDQKQPQDQQQQNQQKQDQEQQPQPQEQPSTQEPAPAEQMTPEEARMLLDRMKQEEQAYRDQLRVIMGQPVPVDKDW